MAFLMVRISPAKSSLHIHQPRRAPASERDFENVRTTITFWYLLMNLTAEFAPKSTYASSMTIRLSGFDEMMSSSSPVFNAMPVGALGFARKTVLPSRSV